MRDGGRGFWFWWRPAVSGMGSGMSSFRRPRGFVFDPTKGMIPLLGLQVALEYGRPGSDRPPVTAALLAANVLVFLRPEPLHRILPRINDVALNYQLFVRVCKRTYLCTAQPDGGILC